ncbi:hypothetical protein HDU76_005662 [Blyttiomyces sp. JEL0837]|nr:hypothetical protein HDU76_005662 [Blyttiomyces sp. JEL0837]
MTPHPSTSTSGLRGRLREQGFSSFWEALPSEIVDQIIDSSDILTQYLNNILTDIQIELNATDIWFEAFRQDWSGDLSLLPPTRFPTTHAGLCMAHSKSMLNRLCNLRPDLDINTPNQLQDTFRVLVKDNTNYGWFIIEKDAPIIALDEPDTIEPGGSTIFQEYIYQEHSIKRISSALINISMRHCFIDDLQPYISDNPMSIAAIAIQLDHFNLLKHLIDDLKLVNLANLPVGKYNIEPYNIVAANNNLDMFKYLYEKGCPYLYQSLNCELLISHQDIGFIKFAYEVNMIHQSYFDFILVCSSDHIVTTNIDIWEWVLDTFFVERGFHVCRLIPIVKDMESAKRVVGKIGVVDKSILSVNANMAFYEVFEYLWDHRTGIDYNRFPQYINEQSSLKDIKVVYMRLDEMDGDRFRLDCTVDAYREAHSDDNVPYCSKHVFWDVIKYKELDFVKVANEVCRCPDGGFGSLHLDEAAGLGRLDVVRYFYRCGKVKCTEKGFYDAARNGDLEMVKYLSGYRNELDCDLDYAVDCAVGSGHVDVVRFLVEAGGNVSLEASEDCVKEGHFRVVEYLCGSGKVDLRSIGCKMMECAVESGSLKMVRYVWGKGSPDSKLDLMEKFRGLIMARPGGFTKRGPKVQIVEFLLVNCFDGVDVKLVFSLEWKHTLWPSFDQRVVEYLTENEIRFLE